MKIGRREDLPLLEKIKVRRGKIAQTLYRPMNPASKLVKIPRKSSWSGGPLEQSLRPNAQLPHSKMRGLQSWSGVLPLVNTPLLSLSFHQNIKLPATWLKLFKRVLLGHGPHSTIDPRFSSMGDEVLVHKVKVSKDWWCANNIREIVWPAQSSHLNPIKKLMEIS